MFSSFPFSSAAFSALYDDIVLPTPPTPTPEPTTEGIDPITPGPWVRRG